MNYPRFYRSHGQISQTHPRFYRSHIQISQNYPHFYRSHIQTPAPPPVSQQFCKEGEILVFYNVKDLLAKK